MTAKQAYATQGRYLRVRVDPQGNLLVRPTKAGWALLADRLSDPDVGVFFELFEDFVDRGWTILRPEQIGALTSCEIIVCPDVEITDDGQYVVHGPIWWHERYAVESFTEELYRHGRYVLPRGTDG